MQEENQLFLTFTLDAFEEAIKIHDDEESLYSLACRFTPVRDYNLPLPEHWEGLKACLYKEKQPIQIKLPDLVKNPQCPDSNFSLLCYKSRLPEYVLPKDLVNYFPANEDTSYSLMALLQAYHQPDNIKVYLNMLLGQYHTIQYSADIKALWPTLLAEKQADIFSDDFTFSDFIYQMLDKCMTKNSPNFFARYLQQSIIDVESQVLTPSRALALFLLRLQKAKIQFKSMLDLIMGLAYPKLKNPHLKQELIQQSWPDYYLEAHAGKPLSAYEHLNQLLACAHYDMRHLHPEEIFKDFFFNPPTRMFNVHVTQMQALARLLCLQEDKPIELAKIAVEKGYAYRGHKVIPETKLSAADKKFMTQLSQPDRDCFQAPPTNCERLILVIIRADAGFSDKQAIIEALRQIKQKNIDPQAAYIAALAHLATILQAKSTPRGIKATITQLKDYRIYTSTSPEKFNAHIFKKDFMLRQYCLQPSPEGISCPRLISLKTVIERIAAINTGSTNSLLHKEPLLTLLNTLANAKVITTFLQAIQDKTQIKLSWLWRHRLTPLADIFTFIHTQDIQLNAKKHIVMLMLLHTFCEHLSATKKTAKARWWYGLSSTTMQASGGFLAPLIGLTVPNGFSYQQLLTAIHLNEKPEIYDYERIRLILLYALVKPNLAIAWAQQLFIDIIEIDLDGDSNNRMQRLLALAHSYPPAKDEYRYFPQVAAWLSQIRNIDRTTDLPDPTRVSTEDTGITFESIFDANPAKPQPVYSPGLFHGAANSAAPEAPLSRTDQYLAVLKRYFKTRQPQDLKAFLKLTAYQHCPVTCAVFNSDAQTPHCTISTIRDAFCFQSNIETETQPSAGPNSLNMSGLG